MVNQMKLLTLNNPMWTANSMRTARHVARRARLLWMHKATWRRPISQINSVLTVHPIKTYYNILKPLKHSLKTVKSVISNTDMMTSHVHFIVSLRFCRQVCRALRVLKQAESIHSFDSDIILIKHLTWSESDQDGLTVEFWRLLNSMTYLSHARCQLRHVGKKEPVPWCLASFCIDKLIQKFVPVCHDEIPDAHKGCFGLLLYHVQKQWKVAMKITCFFAAIPTYMFSANNSAATGLGSHIDPYGALYNEQFKDNVVLCRLIGLQTSEIVRNIRNMRIPQACVFGMFAHFKINENLWRCFLTLHF